jgi:hypothetical protein
LKGVFSTVNAMLILHIFIFFVSAHPSLVDILSLSIILPDIYEYYDVMYIVYRRGQWSVRRPFAISAPADSPMQQRLPWRLDQPSGGTVVRLLADVTAAVANGNHQLSVCFR